MIADGLTCPPLTRPPAQFSTRRLLLRQWHASDREPFAAMNADPRVMEHFPAPLTREESDRMVERIETSFRDRGFGLWAVEVPELSEFIGFVGLAVPRFEATFMPCVEIAWRLAYPAWNQGYATEAAREVRRVAFEVMGLPELVSFTATINLRSRRVMERIGMRHDAAGDFDHPALSAGHPLERHVLYRLGAAKHATGERGA